jgi:hypothetical protein
MFGRVTAQSIRSAARQVKDHMQNAYSQARHWGTAIDTGVRYAGRVYSAIQPVLKDYAPKAEKAVTRNIRTVKGEYDSIRDRVVSEDTRAGAAVAHVRSKIPDLGL